MTRRINRSSSVTMKLVPDLETTSHTDLLLPPTLLANVQDVEVPCTSSGEPLPSESLSLLRLIVTALLSYLRHVSFVDCPGHDILMATMLTGAAVMDAALLLVAGNESCPQPQTSEHLAAVEIMKLRNILILQNKVDLVREAEALEQQKAIAKFIEGGCQHESVDTFRRER